MKELKIFLKAAIVIAIALVLVIPSSIAVTNREINDKMQFEGSVPYDIKDYQKVDLSKQSLRADNIWISGVDDDILPSITIAPDGDTVVTYTNELSFSESYMGISWSATPSDPGSWNGYIITLSSENCKFFDTAKVEGPEPDDFKGLMGVYMVLDEELTGYYTIEDVDAPLEEWLFYTWTGGAPEPDYACISDMTFYQDLNYPDMWGPFNFYIYREIYDVYDITSCPICFHTDIRNAGGGVGYFDAQSKELTAPANDPDIVDLGDRFHTAIQYTNETTGPHIVWKKVVPSEEPDYEYTPYQDTIATGENPSIAAYGTNVAVAYVDGGIVKCIYSSDDGETWETPVTVAGGEYPAIEAIGTNLYCAYIDDDNLWLKVSDDGGESWGVKEQINDEEGSVVAQENAVDIHAGGVVWVDDRNDDFDIYFAALDIGEPPNAPDIDGETDGDVGTEYDYEFSATDPDGDDIAEYIVNWGDETGDETLTGPFASGAPATGSHTYTTGGDFTITAKAKDAFGKIGPEGSLDVTMPRGIISLDSMFMRILERFPHAFPLLRHIIFGL